MPNKKITAGQPDHLRWDNKFLARDHYERCLCYLDARKGVVQNYASARSVYRLALAELNQYEGKELSVLDLFYLKRFNTKFYDNRRI